jgi:hypothetical protein
MSSKPTEILITKVIPDLGERKGYTGTTPRPADAKPPTQSGVPALPQSSGGQGGSSGGNQPKKE